MENARPGPKALNRAQAPSFFLWTGGRRARQFPRTSHSPSPDGRLATPCGSGSLQAGFAGSSVALVAVVVGLERAFDRHREIVGLLLVHDRQLDARSWRDAAWRPSRRGAWAGCRPSCRTGPGVVHSSIWARVWLVKEADITKDGWPVALPRFTRRPSDSRMMRLPSGNSISSTCGLTLCHFKFRRPRPGFPSRNGRCCRRWRGPSSRACGRW